LKIARAQPTKAKPTAKPTVAAPTRVTKTKPPTKKKISTPTQKFPFDNKLLEKTLKTHFRDLKGLPRKIGTTATKSIAK
jgi:hypothetical protein